MNSRPWRERLIENLREQQLPPAYIDRLVEELAEHVRDLQRENASMEAQHALDCLGTTQQLAAVAGHEFRRRTFAGRYPWLTFIAGPIAIVPALFVSLIAGLMGVGWLISGMGEWTIGDVEVVQLPLSEAESRMEWWYLWCFDGFVRFMPFFIAVWLFCRWARRSQLRVWGFAACTIVAVIAGFMFTKSVPSVGEKPGVWMVGVAFHPSVRQLMQLLAPLAFAGWLLMRMPRASLSAPTANA